ncbi:MAG: hypothetical protein AUK53_03210 [Betaproteobacteria bacterium CG2_30_59_46]|nr:MAG: hypothetical protein AUK53_03210 [Betaproteobacteria bacterium CG2_30_59_46]PJB06588.1 MAG: hypothetical protein CO125_06860 [Hydrogenophilales bacterium CG_4_9_14_3_um_filter_59_35]
MRPSTLSDTDARSISDFLASRLLAIKNIPSPFSSVSHTFQVDLFFKQETEGMEGEEIEELGERLLLWRIEDFFRPLRYAHGIKRHQEILTGLFHPGMEYLIEKVGHCQDVEAFQNGVLAHARQSEKKGLVGEREVCHG